MVERDYDVFVNHINLTVIVKRIVKMIIVMIRW